MPRLTPRALSFALAALIAALAVARAPAALAQGQGGFTVGPHASTLGPGVDASVRLNDWLVLRGEGNYLPFSYDGTYSSVPYSIDVDLASAGGALDVHPFGTGFHISGGVFWNGNQADLSSTPTSNITIGDQTFTPAQVGTLSGELRYNRVAPYLGLGYDSAHYVEGPFSFTFRAGVFYMGDPKVTLRTSGGTLSSSAALQSEIAKEQRNLEDDFDLTRFFPVVTLGFRYRF
jgi:hypothetical protein